ncbi:MAG TPA: peptidoglycan-binding protein [Bacteroidales bacterium]|nr:peptidoglycan-binding protein [Bacteroidales bacterium]
MLTATQIKTAQSIINIFETGDVQGDYGSVTVIARDTGHLTFGRSQTTLGSGGLYELLRLYCDNNGARFADMLKPYLERLAAIDLSLDNDLKLHNILRATADDPVMRDTQDYFFDENYWKPTEKTAAATGIKTALGVAVVYDGHVHGSWGLLRNKTNRTARNIATSGEQKWIRTYVDERRKWLAENDNTALHGTVYRMEAFQRLIDQGYWGLELPLVVCGVEISSATLSSTPVKCYDGPQPGSRILSLQTPMLRGLDVRLIQLGLSCLGIDIKADGIFGQTSARRIKEYQTKNRLPVTGVADVNLISALCS